MAAPTAFIALAFLLLELLLEFLDNSSKQILSLRQIAFCKINKIFLFKSDVVRVSGATGCSGSIARFRRLFDFGDVCLYLLWSCFFMNIKACEGFRLIYFDCFYYFRLLFLGAAFKSLGKFLRNCCTLNLNFGWKS